MRDTTSRAAENHSSFPDSFATALQRAQAEFLEMPGLHLTEAQAARLWCFDSALCSAILSELVASQFLVRTRHNGFARR